MRLPHFKSEIAQRELSDLVREWIEAISTTQTERPP